MRKRGGRLPLAISAGALLLVLQGCIGIETTIKFEPNGSGSASLEYRVSQFVTKLGTAEGEQGSIPLPITDADFRQAVQGAAPNVSLRGAVTRTEDEEDIRIVATLQFDRVESLARVRGFEAMPATLTRDGDRWVFRQVLSDGSAEGAPPIDPDTLEIVRTLFADYDLAFTIEAPTAVRSASLGTVDGDTVTYRIAIADLLQLTERTEMEVIW